MKLGLGGMGLGELGSGPGQEGCEGVQGWVDYGGRGQGDNVGWGRVSPQKLEVLKQRRNVGPFIGTLGLKKCPGFLCNN